MQQHAERYEQQNIEQEVIRVAMRSVLEHLEAVLHAGIRRQPERRERSRDDTQEP